MSGLEKINALDDERCKLHTELGRLSTKSLSENTPTDYWPKVFRMSIIANDLANLARDWRSGAMSSAAYGGVTARELIKARARLGQKMKEKMKHDKG